MTIDELLATAGLTGNDEIPIWDAEATGEPTKKITAQNFASAVVALANLVTGVKGDAESSYRHGDVNLTPADIGAVAKAGDTMTGNLTVQNTGYETNINIRKNTRGIKLAVDASGACGALYVNDDGDSNWVWVVNSGENTINHKGKWDGIAVDITHGGTGATTAAGARANLEITPANIGAMQNPDTSAPRYDTGNLNDAPVGFSAWDGRGCVNAPFASWTSVLTISIIAGYVQQIAFPWFPWHSGSNRIAYRVCDNGTWHAWSFITMS